MQPNSTMRRDENMMFGKKTEPEIAMAISRVSPEPRLSKSDEERMHVFWRVFGGAIVSITALIGITMYNGVQSNIAELRAEVAKLHEQRADLVRKDEFNTRNSSSHERINVLMTQNNTQNATLMSLKTDLDGLKDRHAKTCSDFDSARKESSATLDAIKKDVAAVEVMKEKILALTTELKLTRDETLKVRADLDKNQIADQERKVRRDDLQRELDKVVKDLQTAVQDCQVKLARLEGRQQSGPEKTKETP